MQPHRIVVKIGSNILTHGSGGLDYERINSIGWDIAAAGDAGYDVVVVSSGAIAAGMVKLGLSEKPQDIRLKQAAAAVGQSTLMWAYEKSFSQFGKKVAQILLTREVFSVRATYLNSKNTILTLLSHKVIPIVNENDTVSIDEIKFGDNDQLAALVSGLIDAERLIILSDVDGLYTSDPKKDPQACLIRRVQEVTPELEHMAGSAGSVYGTGGMFSKILAAKKAASFGIRVSIISGRKDGLISAVLDGEPRGTEFLPRTKRMSSRKGWIAYAVKPKGSIVLDQGATEALLRKGKSLLPSGIVMTEGHFDVGDVVHCVDACGNRIAKGIVNYPSTDVERIRGRKTSEIEHILGYKYADEVIHRDNLVILKRGLAV